jgi:hypothetical protein
MANLSEDLKRYKQLLGYDPKIGDQSKKQVLDENYDDPKIFVSHGAKYLEKIKDSLNLSADSLGLLEDINFDDIPNQKLKQSVKNFIDNLDKSRADLKNSFVVVYRDYLYHSNMEEKNKFKSKYINTNDKFNLN